MFLNFLLLLNTVFQVKHQGLDHFWAQHGFFKCDLVYENLSFHSDRFQVDFIFIFFLLLTDFLVLTAQLCQLDKQEQGQERKFLVHVVEHE